MSRLAGRGGGRHGGAYMYANMRRTRGPVTPAANDSSFAGGAAATSGTAPTRGAAPTRGGASTRGIGLRRVSKNRIEILSTVACSRQFLRWSGMQGTWGERMMGAERGLEHAFDGRNSTHIALDCFYVAEQIL